MTAEGYWVKWSLFWILGLLNNTPGVVVLSAAKSISESFNKKDSIGALYWANTALGLVMSILAGSILLRFSTQTKMIAAFLCALIGLTVTAVATKVSFELAIVGILFIGIASSLGQATILGYGRFFDPKLVGGWSSGTGGAGIAGTGVYLLLKTVLNLSNLTIFCILIPCAVIYFSAYLVLAKIYAPAELVDFATQQQKLEESRAGLLQYDAENGTQSEEYGFNSNIGGVTKADHTQTHLNSLNSKYAKPKHNMPAEPLMFKSNQDLHAEFNSNKPKTEQNPLFSTDSSDKFAHAPHYGSLNAVAVQEDSFSSMVREQTIIEEQKRVEMEEEFEEKRLSENWCTQFQRVWPTIWLRATMLMTIYFLEYVIISLYANHAAPKKDGAPDEWAYKNAYEVLSFCYQIGVFFSRSSIGCFQLSFTWILTVLQAINFLIWALHAEYLYISPYWILFPAMIWVGVMAGLCYVNTFYSIQNDTSLGKDKEFAINIVSIGINLGITMSSFFTLLADKTWMKK